MKTLKVFSTKRMQELQSLLTENDAQQRYMKGQAHPSLASEELNTKITTELPILDSDDDFTNAERLYNSLEDLDRTLASDQRFWTWMTHNPYAKYMSKRWELKTIPIDKREEYIRLHWFVPNQNARSYYDNGIASLWWGMRMTHDPKSTNPTELSREFFSHRDYTRVLGAKLGRSRSFVMTLMAFVIHNPGYFASEKEAKIRALMRSMNLAGAHTELSVMEPDELKRLMQHAKENSGLN